MAVGRARHRGPLRSTSEPIGTGQTGATYRLTLDAARSAPGADRQGRGRRRRGPQPRRRRLPQRGRLLPAPPPHPRRAHPACWHAAISDDGLRFTLLLEDLSPRVPGVQADGCPADRARGGGPQPGRAPRPALERPGAARPRLHQRVHPGHRRLHRRDHGHRRRAVRRPLPAGPVRRRRGHARAVGRRRHGLAAAPARSRSRSLHGDYRLDNLMFGDGGGRRRRGRLADALDRPAGPRRRLLPRHQPRPSERRRSEEPARRGVPRRAARPGRRPATTPTAASTTTGSASCRDRSSRCSARSSPPPSDSEAADRMFLAMARRSCAAIRDLGSLDLL